MNVDALTLRVVSFLKRLFLHNAGLKLISIMLAFLMWLAFSMEQPIEKAVSVHLEYRNIPPGLEIASQLIGTLDVHIRSTGRARNVSEADFSAFVDLSDATEGERVIHLTRENIRVPFGVEVLKITPPRITLVLEKTIHKIVSVEPRVEGHPAPDYEVVRKLTSPSASVTIIGPRSRINKITKARTETINIEGKSSDVNAVINVDVDDPFIRIQDTKPVRVKIEIREKRKEILVKNVPIVVRPENTSVRIVPKKLDVSVSVPVSFNKPIEPESLRATIDLKEWTPKNAPRNAVPIVEVNDVASGDIKILSFSPTEVELKPIAESKKISR